MKKKQINVNQLDKHRGDWGAVNPVTKVVKSKKVYNRKKYSVHKEDY